MLPTAAPCTQASPTAEPALFSKLARSAIVEPALLAGQIGCAGLRILDVRDRASYGDGHLPGAVWLDRNALSWRRLDNTVTLLMAEPFAALMGRLGIDGETTVVVYDDVWGMHAARVVWALRRYGHRRAAALSGGAEGWVDDIELCRTAIDARVAECCDERRLLCILLMIASAACGFPARVTMGCERCSTWRSASARGQCRARRSPRDKVFPSTTSTSS